jgi:hypothetical protein
MEAYADMARRICQLRAWRVAAPAMVEEYALALTTLPSLGQTVRTPEELAVVPVDAFASPPELALQLRLLVQAPRE